MVNIVDTIVSTVILFSLYSILSLSLNLEYGFTGVPNFGKVAFQAIGAFVAGSFMAHALWYVFGLRIDIFSPEAIQTRILLGQSNPQLIVILFILSLGLCSLLAGIFGYLASYPALRVGEDYLAVVLLFFGEILRLVVRNYPPLVGGTQGLVAIPNPFSWIPQANVAYLLFAGTVLAAAVLVYVYCERLENSPYGRLLRAVRENELAAEVLGKKTFRKKGEVLAIGSALAGLAGGLYTYYLGFVHPDDFGPSKTFDLWLIVILGGTGNNKGVLLGALFVTVLDRVTRFLSGAVQMTGIAIEMNYVRYIATAMIMLFVIAYRPGGMIPEEPIKTPALKVSKRIEDS